MLINTRAAAWAALPLFVLLSGCASPDAGTSPVSSASPVSPAPAPTPTFADVTHGDSETAAMLYSYDATAHSAVLMPVIFMDGPAYCKAFHLKSSDSRCEREWVSQESHVKATLPVSPSVKLLAANLETEDRDCVGSIEKGGSCPVGVKKFQQIAKANKGDFLVHITVENGTVTRIAEEFRP